LGFYGKPLIKNKSKNNTRKENSKEKEQLKTHTTPLVNIREFLALFS